MGRSSMPAGLGLCFLLILGLKLGASLVLKRQEAESGSGCVDTNAPVAPELALKRGKELTATATIARVALSRTIRLKIRRQSDHDLKQALVKGHFTFFGGYRNALRAGRGMRPIEATFQFLADRRPVIISRCW